MKEYSFLEYSFFVEIRIKIIILLWMYLRYIHFCLQQKCEIFAVDCSQIKDLNNLCVRPTIDYLQVNNLSYEISPLHSAMLRFGRNDV